MFWRVNPDEETTNWRAVCGRTARTVRREGRIDYPSLPLSGVGSPTLVGLLLTGCDPLSRHYPLQAGNPQRGLNLTSGGGPYLLHPGFLIGVRNDVCG